MPNAVLIIEDEATLAKNVKTFLSRRGYEVRLAPDAAAGEAVFEEFKPDVLLLDLQLPDANGLDVLQRVRRSDPKVKVVIVTAHGNERIAVEAMKLGAADYLSKPLVLAELGVLLDQIVRQVRLEGALSYYQAREASAGGLDKLVGESEPIGNLKRQIRQILDAERRLTDAPPPAVLITGETGTGKELVARALHYDGSRRDRPFVEINCAAIPTHLVESELFGYERGAFTDARERKLGLVETADTGTLFLDEVGDLDPLVQVKLLKLLEDRVVRRLGSVRDRTVDVRIIAATNQRLGERVRSGSFRSDLYFRLNIVQLEIAPLRERGNDILLLANQFLALHCRRYGKALARISAPAKHALLQHPWPGNVRELRNVIEQAVLLCEEDTVKTDHLCLSTAIMSSAARETADVGPAPGPSDGNVTLAAAERQLLVQALERTAWNVTGAARLLGISRDTLRYRMEKFALKPSA
jgi:two-component system, NtrC family, response regulator AtoC